MNISALNVSFGKDKEINQCLKDNSDESLFLSQDQISLLSFRDIQKIDEDSFKIMNNDLSDLYDKNVHFKVIF